MTQDRAAHENWRERYPEFAEWLDNRPGDPTTLSAVERLAESWNSTPDYAQTEYDRGRVDQRHAMTMQLLEALDANGEREPSYRAALEAVEDHITRHYLDMNVGKELLAIISGLRASALEEYST